MGRDFNASAYLTATKAGIEQEEENHKRTKAMLTNNSKALQNCSGARDQVVADSEGVELHNVSGIDDRPPPVSRPQSLFRRMTSPDKNALQMFAKVRSPTSVVEKDNMMQSMTNVALYDIGVEMFAPRQVTDPLDIIFKGMSLRLKSNNNLILDNLCGELKHGSITALMGPSGAGKTTLLSLLRGSAYFAETDGELRVNGQPARSLLPYRDSIAYVNQNDIMYDELSCEEKIICAALLFNNRNWRTVEEVLPMVCENNLTQ